MPIYYVREGQNAVRTSDQNVGRWTGLDCSGYPFDCYNYQSTTGAKNVSLGHT